MTTKITRGLTTYLAGLALLGGPVFAQSVTISNTNASPDSVATVPANVAGGNGVAGVNLDLNVTVGGSSKTVGIAGQDGALLSGTGHSLLTNDAAGRHWSVAVNTTATANFSGDGVIEQFQVTLPGNIEGGATVGFADAGNSALSDSSGTAVGSVTGGTLTVVTPFPIAEDFSGSQSFGWTQDEGPIGAPFNFAAISATAGAEGLTLTNTGGFRTFGSHVSPNDLVPYYDKCMNVARFTVSSNKATVEGAANFRMRAAVLRTDGSSSQGERNTIATLPEYQIAGAQPGLTGQSPTHVLPVSGADRVYDFPWVLDNKFASLTELSRQKLLATDLIVFDGNTVPTDLTYTIKNVDIDRYDFEAIEAAATTLDGDVDFSVFNVSPDSLGTGNLFPRDGNGNVTSGFENFNNPAKAVRSPGEGGQELAFIWGGGSSNDNTVAFIDTGEGNGFTLVSRYDTVTIDSNDLYIVEFHHRARNGSGNMADRTMNPATRMRINVWRSGESWAVTTNPLQSSHSTPSSNDAEAVVVALYLLPQPEAAGDQLNLSYDAVNFLLQTPNSTNAGETFLDQIVVKSVDGFRTISNSFKLD